MPFGVDEAGKGPVLGSMFAAAVWVDDLAVLPDGVADSKRLTPDRREELTDRLRADDRVHIGLAEITTDRIDDPTTDMNSLSVAAHAEAIAAAVPDESSIPTGICDACDTDADRFARRVTDACSRSIDVDARHGADDDEPIVGAASIVAKVERDSHIATLSEAYGAVGSGYPSDSTTRAFLEGYVAEHGELPPIARSSWSTCADVLAAAQQTGFDQF